MRDWREASVGRAGRGGSGSGGVDLEAALCLIVNVHTPHVRTLRGSLMSYIWPSPSGHGGRAQSSYLEEEVHQPSPVYSGQYYTKT